LIQIQSSALLVTILPEVGGKIGQIRDTRSGCDMLIAPRRPWRTIPLQGDWLEHDTSGMDDCFPNVAQGFYPQESQTEPKSESNSRPAIHLPDLGEWTHGVWEIIEADPARVVMHRSGSALPYVATKTVRFVDEQSLEFSYYVENRGTAPIRYLWSAHPLISVPDAFELELPPASLAFRVFPSDGELRPWPAFQGTHLSREWIPRGANLKVFITGLPQGWCALRLPSHSLRFAFDLESVPVLGIWFNNYGFPAASEHAFRCIALEPCTSPSDLLDELDPSAYPVLSPGQSAQWWLRLDIARVSAQAE
jgi:hypothetical protein